MSATSDVLRFINRIEPVGRAEDAADRDARQRAVDPRFNVVLEASAGTGKTRVLVDRYVNLLRMGVDPSNILAITFTRKAAAEMRDRIMSTLRAAAAREEISAAHWRALRDRTADIAISTIDAFCLSLLREFPLEADVDPGFAVADESELPRLIEESLDRTLRICRSAARDDEHIALVFAQLGERRARTGLDALLRRRTVAPSLLSACLADGPSDLDAETASRDAADRLLKVFAGMPGGLDCFLESGPIEPAFLSMGRCLRELHAAFEQGGPLERGAVQRAYARARDHFLTQEGKERTKSPYRKESFGNEADWRVHKDVMVRYGAAIVEASTAYRRDLNVLVSRGVWRMFRIAESEYRRTLDAHALVDFSDLLLRALELLRRMDDFAQSRYRLESRYHHVLVDEFQDTSRPQWELVFQLIQCWGQGLGPAHMGPLEPSIFVVGDRKQAIYGFRDADVSLLREAARHLEMLRRDGDVRRSISRSFRAVPLLLSFVNDVCRDMAKAPKNGDAFQYEDADRFPVDAVSRSDTDTLGLIAGDTADACADATAAEIARLLCAGTGVRDRATGTTRRIRPSDVAILFRTRSSHREFETALERCGIPSYVYKGLGFYDADEVKDVLALIWYLADPLSNLRAAALLRSRIFRLSDEALRLLAPEIAGSLLGASAPAALGLLSSADASVLRDAREATKRWLEVVDRRPPAELIDQILHETAYAYELRGPRMSQAWENLKKIRAVLRRIQNRGYATMGRIAAHLDDLAVGDEANAAAGASDAVSLMTIHAAKGLEFPVVFLVDLTRGTATRTEPIRFGEGSGSSVSVAVGDFRSDADDKQAAKHKEDTKRLFYVAMTRARDRLYFAAAVTDGRVVPGRGSLAEVVPVSLLDSFSAPAEGAIEWRTSSGAVHRFLRCTSKSSEGVRYARPPVKTRASDFRLLESPLPRAEPLAVAVENDRCVEFERVVGMAVHRMLQRFSGTPRSAEESRDVAEGILRSENLGDSIVGATVGELADAACAAYQAICGRADIRALYLAGERLHEIPFTAHIGGAIVRGRIDCLIRQRSGAITILEFKTGRAKTDHRAQLDLYRQAAERLFPGVAIDTQLIYAGASPS
jgi:ATP-dependent helicase/nuclease subunit A